jgi:hypothetical protein
MEAMLELPVDAWLLWTGLAATAAVVVGVATAFPTAPPPDAAGVANAVDAVAGSTAPAADETTIAAESVRIAPHQVSVRGPGGVARARLGYGPVTPVPEDGRLRAVLRGTPPDEVFESPAALAAAARNLREPPYRWRRTDRISVRSVVWGEVRVTLVG